MTVRSGPGPDLTPIRNLLPRESDTRKAMFGYGHSRPIRGRLFEQVRRFRPKLSGTRIVTSDAEDVRWIC
jgi:hypothetical protein